MTLSEIRKDYLNLASQQKKKLLTPRIVMPSVCRSNQNIFSRLEESRWVRSFKF